MRKLAFIILLIPFFAAKAQQRAVPMSSVLSNPFKDYKRYDELEDHWVVFLKNWDKWAFGFVYFDVKEGYTFSSAGRFGIDAQGKVYQDARDHFKNGLGGDHFLQIARKVAEIPDSILRQLNVKKMPDWVVEYHRTHPDHRTVAMKLRVGKLAIYAPDAAQYIGENAEVVGNIFKGEIRKINHRTDSALVLWYMGNPNQPNGVFIIIAEFAANNPGPAKAIVRQEKAGYNRQIKDDGGHTAAQGKIILFEGKPAIKINYDDLMILEPVD